MSNEMESIINSPTNQAICRLIDMFEELDKKNCGGHIHYGCAWETRGEKVFHVCHEQKIEWEVK